MKWNRIGMIGLALALILALAAGCASSSKTNDSQAASSGANAENSGSGNASGSDISGDLEIQYFVGGYGDTWWKEVISEFQQQHPDLNIKQSAGPKINEQMKPRWIQGDPPDVVYIDGAGSNEAQMVKDDQLMDITEWLKGANNVDGERILDQVIAQPSEYNGGKFYNLPLVFGSWGTFYDKALFAQNNWDVPTDWDSFLALSDQIKASGTSPYIYTGVYPYYNHGGFLFPAIVSNNGNDASILTDMANLKPDVFKSDAIKKALGQLAALHEKGFLYEGFAALNHTDSQALFLQHKAAFIPNGLWLENEMKKDVPDGFDFGFIPSITQPKGEKYVAVPYTNTIAIAKKAKNPDAAKAFLEFIFTKKAAVQWAEMTGALMNYKTDLDASKASDVVKGAMKFYNSDNTIVAPVAVMNSDVEKVMMDSTVAVSNGSITPDEWVDRVSKAADKARGK